MEKKIKIKMDGLKQVVWTYWWYGKGRVQKKTEGRRGIEMEEEVWEE